VLAGVNAEAIKTALLSTLFPSALSPDLNRQVNCKEENIQFHENPERTGMGSKKKI
jgi:hypothetical protein